MSKSIQRSIENLGALLFELSIAERLMILTNLNREALKLSHLAQRQNMTVTETLRNIQRLTNADLIFKDVENVYKITPYGQLILSLLPTLGFVVENRKYFKEHDTSALPTEFVARFGELSRFTFREEPISNFVYHEKMFTEAEEFCWMASTQFHYNAPQIATEILKKGIDVRTLLPENVTPPVGVRPIEGVKRRTLPNFNMVVHVTEKEAAFGLPYLNGKMDYAQYFSKDPNFLKWCRDLYQYYWDRAKPMLGSFPNQH